MNLFSRHYQRSAMVEARKILGGAGPAIATIPASALWASIALVDLGRDLAYGRAGLEVVIPRVFFYTLTSFGQMLGVFPRLLGGFMAVLPLQRSGWLSDGETMERLARRPETTIDALYLAQRDLVLGLATALAGEGRRGRREDSSELWAGEGGGRLRLVLESILLLGGNGPC